jgi:hypothetical protein
MTMLIKALYPGKILISKEELAGFSHPKGGGNWQG